MLRRAERLAAFVESWLTSQHLVEEIDGVIKIVALQRIAASGEKHSQISRQVVQAFLSHASILGKFRPKMLLQSGACSGASTKWAQSPSSPSSPPPGDKITYICWPIAA